MATVQTSEIDWEAFRVYMVARRKKLKITQSEFAEMIGRKQPDISAMEAGRIRPNTVDTFVRIADALQVNVSTLISKFRLNKK